MTCKKCGELLDDHVKFCTNCGAKMTEQRDIETTIVLNPVHTHEEDCVHEGEVVGSRDRVGFVEAFLLFFRRYADFHGRSRRSEYWYGSLAVALLGILVSAVLGDFYWIWSVVIWLPTLSLNIRRLHDIGRSGWWYLINLIPVAGCIIFLIWCCTDSTQDNQWGANPKG